jgi:hypothetical protein
MWLLIAEALLALGVLVFIVWWTMFSGRSNAESDEAEDEARGSRDEEPPPR